jgi:hypothetical protein
MPAKSKKQLKFMQAVANNPAFAKKVGVPTKVGKEFTKEKNMKKGNENALMKKVGRNMAKAKMQEMEKGGKVKKGKSTDKSTVLFNKVKNEVKKSTGPEKNISAMTSERMGAKNKMKKDFLSGYGRVYDMEEKRKNEYKTGSENVEPKAMKKGGSVSNTKMGKVKSNAGRDGVATRGKTKGKFI